MRPPPVVPAQSRHAREPASGRPDAGGARRGFGAPLAVTYAGLLVAALSAFLLDRRIWAVDAAVLAALLTGIYYLRRALNLTPFLFALICALFLAHALAVFGFFRMTILGYEYDTYIHTYSSVVAALVAFNYAAKFDIPLAERLLIALLLALGVGLLNELVEFAGYRLFGRGEGLFLLGPGDIGATDAFENLMTDLLHDFYGNLAGLAIGAAAIRRRPGR